MPRNTESQPVGFTFTETMHGFVSEAPTWKGGAALGKAMGDRLRFRVTIRMEDFNAFLADPDHTASMTGWVESSVLPGRHGIEDGTFNLFARDERGRTQMLYAMHFHDSVGKKYLLEGFKEVHNDWTLDFWQDTTTLFTTLSECGENETREIARGILRIGPVDLVPQVLSMHALNTRSPGRHVTTLARFGLFFASALVREYAPRLRRKHRGSAAEAVRLR